MQSEADGQQSHPAPSNQQAPIQASLQTPPPQQPSQPQQNQAPQAKPNDARAIEAILQTMGVDEYDPRVTHQLLELLYRYVSTVLTEARIFSEHADKSIIDADDIKLAVRSRSSLNFTQPPPREVTSRMAAERNSVPLPPIDDMAGMALPGPVYQLTRQNFRVMQANKTQLDKQKRAREPQARPDSTVRPIKRATMSVSDSDVIVVDDGATQNSSLSKTAAAQKGGRSGGTPSQSQPMDIVDVDAPPVPSPTGTPGSKSGGDGARRMSSSGPGGASPPPPPPQHPRSMTGTPPSSASAPPPPPP